MHADVSGHEVGDRIALRDPERDVVERPRPHRGRITMRRYLTESLSIYRLFAATAR